MRGSARSSKGGLRLGVGCATRKEKATELEWYSLILYFLKLDFLLEVVYRRSPWWIPMTFHFSTLYEKRDEVPLYFYSASLFALVLCCIEWRE